MSPEIEALARRLVACRRWRWLPGMRWVFTPPAPHDTRCAGRITERDEEPLWTAALPDITDPATLGCLLELVREAWGDIGLAVMATLFRRSYRWHIVGGHYHGSTFRSVAAGPYPTEGHALVAMLEAAP